MIFFVEVGSHVLKEEKNGSSNTDSRLMSKHILLLTQITIRFLSIIFNLIFHGGKSNLMSFSGINIQVLLHHIDLTYQQIIFHDIST